MTASSHARYARYRTRWKIVIHSHQSDTPITLHDKLINFNSNKTIKGVGTCSMSFTSSVNLLNTVYPNDYVNVYADRGTGQGWTRLFFGFIDHIEELHRVETHGMPQTIYTLQCSDFQKALEKTNIYFNPHVAARGDFSGSFLGTLNIGGIPLRSIGITINGSPADFVTNVMLLLMGFGSQFTLPPSYNPRVMDRVRQQRADFILNRIGEDVKRSVLEAGGYTQYLEQIRQAVSPDSELAGTDLVRGFDPTSSVPSAVFDADRRRLSESMIRRLGGGGVASDSTDFARERGVAAFNILNTTVAGYPPALIDIIDLFTFLERGAIDGYCAGAPLWERQGSVMNFLRFVSNEVVNELFFDLRPMSQGGGLVSGAEFSREPDDIGGNEADDSTPAGVQYAPAVVMREYPFSTIESVDLSQSQLSISSDGTSSGSNEYIGLLHFGAIFSDQPNVPGRHVITIPNMNLEDQVNGQAQGPAPKHLDVVVVRDKEIVSSRFSRSDNDHFNLFEFMSDSMVGQAAKWFMQDLSPVITPVHIARHGLRVRSLETRFTRVPLSLASRTQESAEPAPEAQAEEAPVAARSATVLPVELDIGPSGEYRQGYVGPNNRWHYRRNSASGVRRYNGSQSTRVPIIPQDTPLWVFHNGVDIRAPLGTPVHAVRDGHVVAAIPMNSTYGNVVIVYHPQDDLFSLYAHLDGFAEGIASNSSSRRLIAHVSEEVMAGGRYEPRQVTAGDVIGFVGSTGSPVRRNRAGDIVAGGVHLHFEFGKKRNGRIYPSSFQRETLMPDYFQVDVMLEGRRASEWGFPISAEQPPPPSQDETISQDPIRVFAEFGVTLPVGTTVRDELVEEPEPEDSTAEVNDPEPVAAAPAEEDPAESSDTQTFLSGHVDTPTARRLLARWTLLQDHWYQHNLEYLDGTIEMRGAPEIRVGYRLDLEDRNLSCYVEGVTHAWSFGQPMFTTLQVTRGQPSNPYPAYVLPALGSFAPTATQRRTGSRLANYFVVPDPIAVRRSLTIGNTRGTLAVTPNAPTASVNETDLPDTSPNLGARYNEAMVEANSAMVVGSHVQMESLPGQAQPSLSSGAGTPPLPVSEEDLVSGGEE